MRQIFAKASGIVRVSEISFDKIRVSIVDSDGATVCVDEYGDGDFVPCRDFVHADEIMHVTDGLKVSKGDLLVG